MNFYDLNQVTTPVSWQRRALAAQAPGKTAAPAPKRRLLLAVAVALLLCVTGCGAVFYFQYSNGILADSLDAVITEAFDRGQEAISWDSPIARDPIPLDQCIADFTSPRAAWSDPESVLGTYLIDGGYCDDMTVTEAEGPLLVRQLFDNAGHTKTEETAEDPLLLEHWQSERLSCDLTWLGQHYASIPYGNLASVTRNEAGELLGSTFRALYTGEGDAYFSVECMFTTEYSEYGDTYLFADEYDALEEYTEETGIQWRLAQCGNQIWASSTTPHFALSIYAANLDLASVREIVEHLDIQV